MLHQLNEALNHHGWKAKQERNGTGDTGRIVVEHVGRYGLLEGPAFGEFTYNPEGQNVSVAIANICAMATMAAKAYTTGCTHAREHERKTVLKNIERWIFDK